ncbi:NRPS protein [Paecilomyces lecythidis]|uniref:NRPS protein n=1 Tax=Paecilomyces lecythidis TaxID=3004212 RepID=A0ABR3Y6H6_9EURO
MQPPLSPAHYAQGTIDSLFTTVALQHPDAIAVQFESSATLTYRELHNQMLQVSAALAPRICHGQPVPVLLPRSPLQVAVILALSHLGAIYVPLDPELPPNLLHDLLDRVDSPVIITNSLPSWSIPSWCHELEDHTVLDLSNILPTVGGSEVHRVLSRNVRPDSVAAILFTSGSTGKPKGVVLTHRNLIDPAKTLSRFESIGLGSRVFQYASFTSNIHMVDILSTLLHGACLCQVSQERMVDRLAHWIRTTQADTIHLTPRVLETMEPDDVPSLRYVVTCSEPVSAAVVSTWSTKVVLRNLYGSCEASSIVSRVLSLGASLTDVGQVSPHAQVKILDPLSHNQVPTGKVGEIFAAGTSVAEGYWRDSKRTAKSFFLQDQDSNKFSLTATSQPSSLEPVWYATGDLGYLSESGDLHLLARTDNHFRVNGLPVEVVAIEQILCRHVARAVVLARPDTMGHLRFFAFVTTQQTLATPDEPVEIDECLSAEELRGYLLTKCREILPAYMVPQILAVNAIPQNQIHKIDRQRLADLLDSYLAREKEELVHVHAPPDLLSQIASIVNNRLHKTVPVDEDLRNWGLSYVDAMYIIWAIFDLTGKRIFLRDVLHNPTVEHLVRLTEASEEDASFFSNRHFAGTRFIVSPHQRSIFHAHQALRNGAYNLNFAFHIKSPQLDVPRLFDAVRLICSEHESLRSTYELNDDSEVVGVIHPPQDMPPTLAFTEFRELCEVSGTHELSILKSRAQQLIREMGEEYVDVSRASPFHVAVYEVAPNAREVIIHFRAHNLSMDELSFERLIHHIFDVYRSGSTCIDTTKLLSYPEYAVRQKRSMMHRQEQDRLWWSSRANPSWSESLSEALLNRQGEISELAIRNPSQNRSNTYYHPLSTLDVEACISHHHRASTRFDFWLSFVQVFLARLASRSRFVLGVPTSTRFEDPCFLNIIGCCVSTAILPAVIDTSESFRTVLDRVHEFYWQCVHHKQPTEEVLQWLSVPGARKAGIEVLYVHHDKNGVRHLLKEGTAAEIVANIDVTTGAGHHPLVIHVDESGSEPRLILEYDAAKFRPEFIASVCESFHSMIHWIATHGSNVTIADIPFCSKDMEERAFAQSVTAIPSHISSRFMNGWGTYLQDLVFESIERNPDFLAIEGPEGPLTYAALGSRILDLSGKLKRTGLRPRMRVTLFLEKSADYVIAMLAVLSAGSTFTILDVHDKPSVNQSKLETVSPQFMITNQESRQLAEQLLLPPTSAVFDLDLHDRTLHSRSHSLIDSPTASSPRDAPAYIGFTSGSTAASKCFQVNHAAAATSILNQVDACGLKVNDRIAMLTNVTFDVSLLEVFATLSAGATLVAAPHDRFVSSLAGTLNEFSVSHVFATPTTISHLDGPSQVPSVRCIILGGEQTPKNVFHRWTGKVTILGSYGSAETTIATHGFTMWEPSHSDRRGSCIGKPVPSVKAAILDEYGHILPAGWVGRLAIAARTPHKLDQLSAGYLNHGHDHGRFGEHKVLGRIFDTGDLCYFDNKGYFYLTGRAEDQIKSNGFWFNISEVESAVDRCLLPSQIQAAVLIARQNAAEGLDMVAFICQNHFSKRESIRLASVLSLDDHRTVDELIALRSKVSDILPSALVPRYWVPVSDIPQGPTGKVNRHLLKEWFLILHDSGFSEKYATLMHPPIVKCEIDHSNVKGDLMNWLRENYTGYNEGLRQRLMDALHSQSCDSDLDVETIYLPSAMQKTMLAQSLIDPELYTNQLLLKFTGSIDAFHLREAWLRVCQAHPSLRTCYIHLDDGINEFFAIEKRDAQSVTGFSVADHIPLGPDELEKSLTTIRKSALTTSKTTSTLTVFSRTREEHLVVLTYHHAIADRESMSRIISDFAVSYKGQHLQPGISFSAVSASHLHRDRTKAEAFWREYVAGSEPVSLHQAEAAISRQTRIESRQLDKLTSQKVQSRALDYHVTLPTFLQTALGVSLARVTGASKPLFWTVTSGRELDISCSLSAVGNFLNVVPCVVPVGSQYRIRHLLHHLHAASDEAFPHSWLPASSILPMLRNQTGIKTLLAIENHDPISGVAFGEDLRVESVERQEFTHVPFTVIVRPRDCGISIAVKYDISQVPKGVATRLLDTFVEITEGISSYDIMDVMVGDIVSDEQYFEKDYVLQQIQSVNADSSKQTQPWNDTLVSLFQNSTKENPKAPALYTRGLSLTYKQLDELSSRLAKHLLRFTQGRQMIVPILFPRKPDMIIAMLAVLKAGAAYCPLDMSAPASRLDYIIREVNASVILTDDAGFSVMSAELNLGLQIVNLDALRWTFYDNDEALLPEVAPSSPCYVLFTSGSTGEPKGCILSHRAVASSIKAALPAFQLDVTDRVLLFANYIFDASVIDIYGTLSGGAALILVPDDEVKADLCKTINDLRVTFVHLTPTIAQFLDVGKCPTLRTVVAGGEAVPQGLRNHLAGRVRFIGNYGPTEAAVQVAVSVFERPSHDGTFYKALPGNVLAIINEQGKVAREGEQGEIYIGGRQLFDGYLKDAISTRGSLLKIPSLGDFLFYRSGDRGRYMKNMGIEILGRQDDQMKFLGQRVDPAEIETVLNDAPGVALSAVVIVAGGLHAALQRKRCAVALDLDSVRAYAAARLPARLVPVLWEISVIPLLPSNKVARRTVSKEISFMIQRAPSLPTSMGNASICSPIYIEATPNAITTVTSIVSRILALPVNDIHKPLDHLGLNSLGFVQLHQMIHAELGVLVPYSKLRDARSIDGICRWLFEAAPELLLQKQTGKVATSSVIKPGRYSATPIQENIWTLQTKLPDVTYAVERVFKIHSMSVPKLVETLNDLVRRFDIFHLTFDFDIEKGQICQIVHPYPQTKIGVQFFPSDLGPVFETPNLDLKRGPLSAFQVHESPDGQVYLHAAVHHILFDEFTSIVFYNALEAMLRGAQINLEEYDSTVNFRGITPGHAKGLQESWTRKLNGISALPRDHSAFVVSNALSQNKSRFRKEISMPLVQQNQTYLNSHALRDSSTLLALFQATLHRTLMTDQVALSVPVSLRTTGKENSSTLGNLTSPAFIRSQLKYNDTWSSFISRTSDNLEFARQHSVPVNWICSWLQIELSEFPLHFVVHQTSPQGRSSLLQDRTFEMIPPKQPAFNFEFHLFLSETGFDILVDYNPLIFARRFVQDVVDTYSDLIISVQQRLSLDLSEFVDLTSSSSNRKSICASEFTPPSSVSTLSVSSAFGPQTRKALASYTQRRFYLLQKAFADASYSLPSVHQVVGFPIDLIMQKLKIIVEREAIFRSYFIFDQDLWQVTSDKSEFAFSIHDLRNRPYNSAWNRMVQLCQDDASRPFDLGNPPLIRCHGFQLPGEKQYLYLNVHQIICDESSLSLLLNELEGEHHFPRTGIVFDYQDISASERKILSDQAYVSSSRHHWQSALTQGPAIKGMLPLDITGNDASLGIVHSTFDITTATIPWAHEIGAESSSKFLSVFMLTMLLRYDCKAPTVVIPVSNLPENTEKPTYGCFTNILPVRAALDAHLPVLDNTKRVVRAVNEALVYSQTPFEKVIEYAGVDRNDFEAMFVYHESSRESGVFRPAPHVLESQGKSFRPKFPLTFSVSLVRHESSTTLDVKIEYDPRMLAGYEADNLAESFHQVLLSLHGTRDPAFTTTNSLGFLSDVETRLLESFHGPKHPEVDREPLVHDQIMNMASKFPHRTAISFDGEESCTYEQLHVKVASLVSWIQQQDLQIEGEATICIFSDACVDRIVCILAIMQLGLAYVPLSVQDPIHRTMAIIQDCKPQAILVPSTGTFAHWSRVQDLQRELEVHVLETVPCFIIPESLPQITDTVPMSAYVHQHPSNIACVLYTSGPASLTKGVAIDHQALRNSITQHRSIYRLQPRSRLLQLAPYTFDVSVVDIFSTLSAGATLVIGRHEFLLSNLQQVVRDWEITHIATTPTVATMLAPALSPSLEVLALGGETMSETVRDTWAEHVHLLNVYGPTETTVNVVSREMFRTTPVSDVGRPLANVLVYILDDQYRRLPPGRVGQLAIGGVQVAHGYLRPQSGKPAFLTHDHLGKIYLTGDLAKFTTTGDIILLGRADSQIKREIEAILNRENNVSVSTVSSAKWSFIS